MRPPRLDLSIPPLFYNFWSLITWRHNKPVSIENLYGHQSVVKLHRYSRAEYFFHCTSNPDRQVNICMVHTLMQHDKCKGLYYYYKILTSCCSSSPSSSPTDTPTPLSIHIPLCTSLELVVGRS